MRPFVACAFVALLSGAVLAVPEDVLQWEAFKAKHGKQHGPEDAQRMQRFLEKDAEIKAHNARYAAGLESFSVAHNQFSDFTADELSSYAFSALSTDNETELAESTYVGAATVPESFDWREKNAMTPVKDQGGCGACYAFASVAVVESFLKRYSGNEYDLSEQDVIDCSFERFTQKRGKMNVGCWGGSANLALLYYEQRGLVEEKLASYTSGKTKKHTRCNENLDRLYVLKGEFKYTHVKPTNEDDLRALLVEKGPLVVNVGVSGENAGKFAHFRDGIYDIEEANKAHPNRLVVLVGYGSDNGKPYWVIRNSWGTGWGVGGYAKIARGKNMCNIMKGGARYVHVKSWV